MNKKGQTLIAFVIIIPAFILLLAFTVDTGMVLKEKTKVSSTTRSILKTTYEHRLDNDYQKKVKELYEKNKIALKKLDVTTNNTEVIIEIETEQESIFGKIIGIQSYKIKEKLKITENNKIIKE